jgi:cholesterol transport system auxiliary component
MLALAAGLLTGCAFGTPAAVTDIRYDFGPAAPVASTGPLPAVKVLDVSAPQMLNNDRLIYRLSYVDNLRTASYAESRWTMPPAQLLTQRLRGALSSHGSVLTGGDGVHAPVLRVNLEEFEQVFDGELNSHGALTARATLMLDGKLLGQRTFVSRVPASTADAAGGARALAAASDDFVTQLVAWLGTTPMASAP